MRGFYKVKELDSRLRGNDNPVILGLDPGIHLNSDDSYDDDEEYEKEWCD
jgi:hypothetical protein